MNILYIAYSCSPYHGSEDKIGWNIPVECAKKHNVFVITKEEQRPYIEKYLQSQPVRNLKFFYVDIPAVYKKLFIGPMYSGRLNFWNRRAMSRAKEICVKEKIDVIHQITPIEFRSIGDYGKIPGVKFVCGPIGGGVQMPKELLGYLGSKHRLVEQIRTIANWWYKTVLAAIKKFKNIDDFLFVNKETAAYLESLIPSDIHPTIQTEVGLSQEELASERQYRTSGRCHFLVAGRLIYLKGHRFLFDALKRLPEDSDYVCRIVGDGPEKAALQDICSGDPVLSKHVQIVGSIAYEQMQKEYESADVLVFPSFREATGSVILEAMSKGVPVITIDKFGGAILLDENTGWLYTGTDRESYIENLKNAILECIDNPEEVARRGANARIAAENHTWEKKVHGYLCMYNSLVT